MNRLFPRSLWNYGTVAAWLTVLLKLLIFDVIWCSATTFTAFQYPELYLNTLLLSLVLASPEALGRWKRVQWVIFVLTDLWLVSNLMYCRTYTTAIPLPSYLLVSNLSDFTASVADQLRWIDILFPATTIGGIAIMAGHHDRKQVSGSNRLLYTDYIVILLTVTVAINQFKGGFRKSFDSFAGANVFSCTTPVYTLAGKLFHDFLKSSEPLAEADGKAVKEWMDAIPPLPQLSDSSRAAPRSVVFILCESLESWVIGREVDGQEVTPNLNRLVADSTALYCPRVLSQVADGRSIDGQLLLFAGLRPLRSGAWSMDYASNRFLTLQRALVDKGARSYLLTVDKDVTWNQRSVARSFGIDTLLARDCWINDQPVGARKKLGDVSFFRQITEKMDAGEIWPEGEKGFVQIVTYSGHNPFKLPDEYKIGDFSGPWPQRLTDYMTMARFTDEGIGHFIDYLRSRPDFESTMIVITGDHEGLAADRPEVMASPAAKDFTDIGRYTPLIVLNSPVTGRHDAVMGQIDVYPTLLTLMGGHEYPWRGAGFPIFDEAPTGFAVTNSLETVGDTTRADADALRHARFAPIASDLILRYNLLDTVQSQPKR